MAPHLFPHLSTRNKYRLLSLLFLLTLPWFPSFLPSFPLLLSLSLYTARSKRSHTDARILTHTLLSPVASPDISPRTHTCTRSEWQLANFYTAGNCFATPPTLLPLSLSPCISECLSTTLHNPPLISPPPSVLRGREPEAQPRSKTLKAAVIPWLASFMQTQKLPHKHMNIYI